MKLRIITILILCIFKVEISYALSLEVVDKIDIKAIKSILLKRNANEFRADVIVQFSSTATMPLKFKESDFVIRFKEGKGQEIFLGTTKPKEIVFSASDNGNEQLQEEKLDVFVGNDDLETITRLVNLFNLIGNPNADFAMILSGSTEIGVKAKRGWIYQGRVQLEDFTFHPTIQREVLFK
jgi:hypothetical protein